MPSATAILPDELSRQLSIYRLGSRLREHPSPKLRDLPAAIERSIDRQELEKLWLEVKKEYKSSPTSAAKYAKPKQWLLLNTLRAAELGLQETKGLRILDIGCGPAYFLRVARTLDHSAEGVDAPTSYLTDVERRVYSRLIDILQMGRYVTPLLIERFAPLPYAEGSYDLITAFWICFNRHRQADEWGRPEWEFFVEDARRKLRPGGRLFLDLNENPERYGPLRFYDSATLEFLRSAGQVDEGRITISRE